MTTLVMTHDSSQVIFIHFILLQNMKASHSQSQTRRTFLSCHACGNQNQNSNILGCLWSHQSWPHKNLIKSLAKNLAAPQTCW